MATRWFLPPSGGSPGITPTPAAEWDDTANFTRVVPSTTKTNQAFSTQSFTYATATANLDSLFKQFVYPLIPGTAFTTSDTFKGRVLVAEGSNASNLRSQAIIRVIASDGTTVRATLYAGDTTTGSGNPTSEWALTTLTNRQVPRGTTVTCAANYTAVTGDYLVIELGYRKHAAASTTGSMRWGDNNASDLAENETATTDANTWLEWSGTEATPASYATGNIFVPTDTFTAADGTDVDAYDPRWGTSRGSAPDAKIDTNRAYPTGSTFQESIHHHAAPPISAEYDVKGTWRSPNTNSHQGMLLARASGTVGGSNHTCYKFYTQNVSHEIQKCVNNSNTGLASWFRNNTAGMVERVECLVRDGSKKLLVDGVERMSTPNNDITGAGKVGFDIMPIAEAGSATTGYQLDDFQAQDTLKASSTMRPMGSRAFVRR